MSTAMHYILSMMPDPELDYGLPKPPEHHQALTISQKRNSMGLTQKEMAARLSIKPSLYADYERGTVAIPGCINGAITRMFAAWVKKNQPPPQPPPPPPPPQP